MTNVKGQKGAAVVEFAILSALLAAFVFGIIEFGFLWLQSHYIGNAAREGARIAAKSGNASDRTSAAENAVQSVLGGLYSDVSDCCGTSDFIHVDVDEDAELDADGTALESVRVTVTVQTAQIWDPVLWDLLSLLQAPDREDVESITQSAIFVLE